METEKCGVPPISAAEHRSNLERRLQAQLKDGSRCKNVKRLGDPLAKHLLRVAGNASYRNLRQSVIVTGKTLICELLSRFPCRRLAVRRQGLPALRSHFSHLYKSADFLGSAHKLQNSKDHQAIGGHDDVSITNPQLSVDIETHYVNNRILRKVAGFHSYDDGCVAEMRMPEPAENLGNIRLLLCLGRLPQVPGQTKADKRSTSFDSAPDSLESGAIGTLLRTAAALQWQGVWILPSCLDIFNPLAIRASQGALFWLPYRRGGVDELVQFCRAKDLAICIPQANGIPVRTSGIFERKKKGVCLVLDSTLVSYRENAHATVRGQQLEASRGCSVVASDLSELASANKVARKCVFEPDISLSLGNDVVPEGSMQLLHPITVASLLLYHTKEAHFPDLTGSPYIFSVKQRL